MGPSIEAFGPQLSGFAAAHRPPRPEQSLIDDDVSSRFHDVDEVIDFVLGVLDGACRAVRADNAPLSKREFEIAALIESGACQTAKSRSDWWSPRARPTVTSKRILTKLGFSSRAQVAA
jgi:hypothetical protein